MTSQLQTIDREALIAVLRSVNGNKRKAAEQLQISRGTLYRRLREYQLDKYVVRQSVDWELITELP
jgi:transcriptional regulator of acetoin/glycerol metabolism